MINLVKIWFLKRKCRRYYAKATTLPSDVDCGLAMYHTLRPDLAAYVHHFNLAMDELAKLDETCPTYRLKEMN